jgi:hypothetical protein
MTYTNEELERMKRNLGIDKGVKKKVIVKRVKKLEEEIKDSEESMSYVSAFSQKSSFGKGKLYTLLTESGLRLQSFDLAVLAADCIDKYGNARYVPEIPSYLNRKEYARLKPMRKKDFELLYSCIEHILVPFSGQKYAALRENKKSFVIVEIMKLWNWSLISK